MYTKEVNWSLITEEEFAAAAERVLGSSTTEQSECKSPCLTIAIQRSASSVFRRKQMEEARQKAFEEKRNAIKGIEELGGGGRIEVYETDKKYDPVLFRQMRLVERRKDENRKKAQGNKTDKRKARNRIAKESRKRNRR